MIVVPPPFTFPEGVVPFGCYATCGVMGATQWDLVSWMGRPVQWCGLVYSAALYDYARLCKPDEAAFWRTVADGIVAHAVGTLIKVLGGSLGQQPDDGVTVQHGCMSVTFEHLFAFSKAKVVFFHEVDVILHL